MLKILARTSILKHSKFDFVDLTCRLLALLAILIGSDIDIQSKSDAVF